MLQGFLGNVCEERVVAEIWLCSSPSTNRQNKHAQGVFQLIIFFSQNSPEEQHNLPLCSLSLSGEQWQIIIILHVPFPSYHCQMEVTKDHTVSLGLFSVGGIFPEAEYGLLHGSKKEEQAFWKVWNPWVLSWAQLRSNSGLKKRWHTACMVLQRAVLQTFCSSARALSWWFLSDYFGQWYCSKWAILVWKSLINQHSQIQNLFPVFAKFIATHSFE